MFYHNKIIFNLHDFCYCKYFESSFKQTNSILLCNFLPLLLTKLNTRFKLLRRLSLRFLGLCFTTTTSVLSRNCFLDTFPCLFPSLHKKFHPINVNYCMNHNSVIKNHWKILADICINIHT